ncbi:MAG: DNA integrity scanning protein DisA nucleotide-binding domain protein [Candidatus Omnitrophica bacterium]|nr:DNA integrity scanning protein DisA nucleotide-binding domain protein [Candidatus Omnitrophota bacterium]
MLEIFLRIKRSILTGKDFSMQLPDYLLEICKAMEFLASRKVGVLIILRRKDKLDEYMDSGILFDAQIKSEIVIALFSSASPVHDGAVVIFNGRIRRVKAILSIRTDTEVPMGIGTRHRSAIGITEKTDAIALVVSEERGEISIVSQGCLIKVDSLKELYRLIKKALKGKSIVPV